MKPSKLYYRLQIGIPIDKAVSSDLSFPSKAKMHTVNGFTGNMDQIAEKFGISKCTIATRMSLFGKTLEETVNTLINENCKGIIYTVNGFTGNINQIAKHFGINYATLYKRLRGGASIEEAVNTPVKERKKKV